MYPLDRKLTLEQVGLLTNKLDPAVSNSPYITATSGVLLRPTGPSRGLVLSPDFFFPHLNLHVFVECFALRRVGSLLITKTQLAAGDLPHMPSY